MSTQRKQSTPRMLLCILSVICICLSACSTPARSENETDTSTDSANIPTENKMSDSQHTQATEATEETVNCQTINFGELQTLDFVEFTIDGASSGDEIKPDHPQNVYSYSPDQDGEKYIYIYGTIKNVSGNQFEFADNMFAKMTFDDKYNYRANITADEDGSFSYIYAYLDPLKSEKFYIVASVPDEMASQYNKVEIKFGFAKNFDGEYNIKEDECDYLYSITVTK